MCMISGCRDEDECDCIETKQGKIEGWQASKRLDVRMMEGQLFPSCYLIGRRAEAAKRPCVTVASCATLTCM